MRWCRRCGKDWRGGIRTIYILIDPHDGEIRYVGSSTNIGIRFDKHLANGNPKTPKERWIKELASEGLEPIMEPLIELTNGDDEREHEDAWIRRFTLAGCKLYNHSGHDVKLIQMYKHIREAAIAYYVV